LVAAILDAIRHTDPTRELAEQHAARVRS
jgi:hypothetical protein